MADQLHRSRTTSSKKTERGQAHDNSHRSLTRANSRTKRASFNKGRETAEQYCTRLRELRKEAGDAEVAEQFYSFTSTGSENHTVYSPAKGDPANIKNNTRYAFNGESWWLVERVFAARDEPPEAGLTWEIDSPGGLCEGDGRSEPEKPKRQVLVKWVGWPKPTWEPLRNLEGKDELIDFIERHGDPKINDGPAKDYLKWFKL